MGGSLRLFSEHVFEGSYFRDSEETSLYISVSMPSGSTVKQMNELVKNMEGYLKQFPEIRMFQANIYPRNSSIQVYFKKEFQTSGFPYQLKSQVISKAIELGGADWGVFGFGDGFSNSVHETAGNYMVEMLGYNYDELNELAGKLKLKLLENLRVKEVYILPERTWYKPDNTEFLVSQNKTAGSLAGITPADLYASLQNVALTNNAFTSVYSHGSFENVRLFSAQSNQTDVWQLERMPLRMDSTFYKFNMLCQITKEATTPSVCKEDQQYILILQFDYIGSDKFARKHIDKTLVTFKPMLPLGYSAQTNEDSWYWNRQNKKQYWLLGLVIVMIFFICAILFESLLQPFAVILTIPVAYIGVFLTFYLFDLNFDQGGFAAFVMLSGITVNAAIYILNDFNSLKRSHAGRNIPDIKLYFKAFNYKIIPIFLTVISTILGFVPFLIGEKQPFWFSLAAGTIGGLIFSMVGIVVYLPLFLKLGMKK
ncbi:MAG: efflux RND transporter permease subunit [Bacteroidetes bacterium]|nr:efflux RND transporter permease subunit [Bacteroidota bacterium]